MRDDSEGRGNTYGYVFVWKREKRKKKKEGESGQAGVFDGITNTRHG